MTEPRPPAGRPGPSEPCNTFAVPMVIDYFGKLQRVVWQKDGPLVFWQVVGADELWVPIDHTERLLDHFATEGPQPDQITDSVQDNGHLVVVSGPRQSGKTTLLHRAAYDLAQRLDAEMRALYGGRPPAGPPGPARERWTAIGQEEWEHVRIIPVAGPHNSPGSVGWADGVPLDIDQVHDRILRVVRAYLGKPNPEQADAPRREDLSLAYERLSRELAEDGRALLILLPDFGWGEASLTGKFYRSCRDNARCGIVFFIESRSAETCADDLRGVFGEELWTERVTHLALGPMSENDWLRFIEARHRAPIPGTAIRVADEVTAGPRAVLPHTSVGKLRKMLHAAAQHAARNRRPEVDAATLDEIGTRTEFQPPAPGRFRRDGGGPQQTEES